MKPVIGITLGDVAGIGPEVVVKALLEAKDICRPVVYGFPAVITHYLSQSGKDIPVVSVSSGGNIPPDNDDILIMDCGKTTIDQVTMGQVSGEWGKAAMVFIESAVRDAMKGKIDAVVTAPINKEGIHMAGYEVPGHTEFLAQLTDTPEVAMMLVVDTFRVALVTIHQSIRSVPDSITTEKICSVTRLAHENIRMMGIAEPRLAVCSLNPHAGEAGSFGNEEIETIIPAIEVLKKEGMTISGPFPSDTLFHYALKGNYDGVIAMYHDQGLIPVKMLGFDRGVNVTLGLPIIRTSPDHGTAYDIAGKDIADDRSMTAAITLAIQMVQNKK